jgi:mono/diheme cytochrome c family protein
VLLDRLDRGAADPWGIALAPDGSTAWVALSGANELVRVDVARLIALLTDSTAPPPWDRFHRDRLHCRLDLLASSGLATYLPLPGSPRFLAMAPDGRTLAIALPFSGAVEVLSTSECRPITTLRWADPNQATPEHRGERLFHDATHSFQGWISCATCHPDGRADGLNWDLLNDGVGNPKNTRSLVLAPLRAPAMSLGVRSDGPTAVAAGLRFISFHEPTSAQTSDLLAYLRTLRPRPPASRTEDDRRAGERGRLLFAGKAGCIACHADPWGSDGRSHEVGTITNPLDAGRRVTTPMLIDLWATAPYLHDGSAPTLTDVLDQAQRSGRHGEVRDLTQEEREDLCRYLFTR